jgi:hypothetical protein
MNDLAKQLLEKCELPKTDGGASVYENVRLMPIIKSLLSLVEKQHEALKNAYLVHTVDCDLQVGDSPSACTCWVKKMKEALTAHDDIMKELVK